MRLLVSFDNYLEKVSRYGLIVCLFAILFLAVSAIVLRWFGSSVMWIDPLVRHLVFLSAFFGGSVATRSNVHIKVDLLTKLVEASSSRLLHLLHKNLVSLFCFVTTLVLFKAGWDFYIVEKEFGAPAFLHIHSSWLVAIIPFGIGLIALRFLNQLLLGVFTGERL
jgi:TRAP-type C4-dicarboxylate transport system permease small subunit